MGAWRWQLGWLLLLTVMGVQAGGAAERQTSNVLLVTIDGLRWQELFSGADERLMDRQVGGVRDVPTLRERFWAETPDARRERLMPFFWNEVAKRGQVFGDMSRQSVARVTNGRYFSYPGYNEILSGFADERIDSNAKRPNPNVTVLEWLNRRPDFAGQVAAFTSWDVFPFILHAERSGIYVNSGWQELDVFAQESDRRQWNLLARDLPRYWAEVRYDAFTVRGAMEYLRQRRPRVLYVSLGEVDDWAHDGRYDHYLESTYRSDQFIKLLWDELQSMDEYRGQTSLVITTDHGRGDDREGWKSHGTAQAGSEFIWIAVLGPDTPATGLRFDVTVTQSQVAATVAALLGEDFATTDARIAPPLPGVVGQDP